MTTDATTTARLDAPLALVEARSILSAAAARTHSPSDRLAYLYDQKLGDHPELCSTDADYSWWSPSMGCCPTHAVGGAA